MVIAAGQMAANNARAAQAIASCLIRLMSTGN
jgi:hypothetical protein